MNVILIVICVVFVLLKKSQADYKKILSGISVEDALSLMNALGVDQNVTQALNSLIPAVMSDEQDFLTLLKNLIPLITSFASTNGAKKEQNSDFSQNATFSPDENAFAVDQFASDDIKQSLNDFFN